MAVRARDGLVPYDAAIETLTFLFTDIEGSTALLRRIGDNAYAQALAEHHRIIRECVARHDGREEGTHGDAFVVAFTSPRACVAAAMEIQRALAAHEWPRDEVVRVRMGIHTGEAASAATGLVGYEVHRAARVGAVAHGGQVLLSAAAAGLVEDSLPPEVGLRELGAHRLKDLGRPEILFQLEAEGLRSDFPPLRSLDNPDLPNNLPASLSPFIGRLDEVDEVVALVMTSRLVTLTGAGGSGKTRLALQAAAEMLDGSGQGVWFVELAPLSDPELVASTVLATLGLRQEGAGAALDALQEALREQNILIVLDNCEHVIDSVAKLTDAVGRTCPRVRLMTTSREPLGVEGEEVYKVRSLALPDAVVESAEEIAHVDSIEMFVARARSHDKAFELVDSNAPLVASICRRLDGIPLALELAAARLSSMSIDDLHRRLDQRFRLLTGGSRNSLPRQQTLGAMVAWSYDLLNEPERVVLRRLSVFANGFDLEAAEVVCAGGTVDSFDVADIVGSLVNKNLVAAERGATSLRYRLLETIRQYAAEQHIQVDGDVQALETRSRHAEHFLQLVTGAQESLAAGPEQVTWMRRFDGEWDNLQTALAFLADDEDRAVDVVRFCVALHPFIAMRRHQETGEHLATALARAQSAPPDLRANALLCLLTWGDDATTDDDQRKVNLAERVARGHEALELARRADVPFLEAWALWTLAFAARSSGDLTASYRLADEGLSVAAASGDVNALAYAEWIIGMMHEYDENSAEERRRVLRSACDHFREAQNLSGLASALLSLSIGFIANDDQVREAMALNEEAIALAEQVGSLSTMTFLLGNGSIYHLVLGDLDEAEAKARRALIQSRRLGHPAYRCSFWIYTLACCATLRGDLVRGARLTGAFEKYNAMRPQYDGGGWTPLEQAMREANAERLRVALGEDAFAREVAVGEAMNFDHVVALALERPRVGA